jgi:hypothetical protein
MHALSIMLGNRMPFVAQLAFAAARVIRPSEAAAETSLNPVHPKTVEQSAALTTIAAGALSHPVAEVVTA